jgi:deoxycytidylate deaminase
MRDYDSAKTRISEFEGDALNLVNRDEHEDAVSYGQRLRDVFPLADVFVDAATSDSIRKTIQRFLRVVFGYNFYSPTREEYGMYIAKSAALRSSDLSRQVGAAVFSGQGEVKVLGCNEVPSPNGGTYWEDDQGDSREFKVGLDTIEEFKHRLLSDVVKNFVQVGILDKRFSMMPSRRFLKVAKRLGKIDLEKQLLMMDLIEYGRIIHAEMNAITHAARKGISLQDGILYCTTFPCHLCAKHIISSGIKKVIYIEPYPESYAQELYRDEIYLGRTQHQSPERVHFEPFIGVAPFRFRDFLKKENGRILMEGQKSGKMASHAQF